MGAKAIKEAKLFGHVEIAGSTKRLITLLFKNLQ
jgi:hypothetical protein